MKHETFKDAAVTEAFDTIEGRILPSLTMLVELASSAEAGVDAAAAGDDLRALARELEELTRLFEGRAAG